MADPVFIQPNTAAHGLMAPLVSPAGIGGFSAAFATILSGLLDPGHQSDPRHSGGTSSAELPVASAENSREIVGSVRARNNKVIDAKLHGLAAAPPSAKVLGDRDRVAPGDGEVRDAPEKATISFDEVSDRFDSGTIDVDSASDSVGQVPDSGGEVPDPSGKVLRRSDMAVVGVGESFDGADEMPCDSVEVHHPADKTVAGGVGVNFESAVKVRGHPGNASHHTDKGFAGVGWVPDGAARLPDGTDKVVEISENGPSGVIRGSDAAGKVFGSSDKVIHPSGWTSQGVGKAFDADGKVLDGRERLPTRAGKASSREIPPEIGSTVALNAPTVISAPVELLPPPGGIPVSTQLGVPILLPGLDGSVAAADQVSASDVQKNGDPHRADIQSPQNEKPVKSDHLDATTPSASPATDVKSYKFVGRSDAMAGIAEPALLSNFPQVLPSGTASPILPRSDQDLAARPADHTSPGDQVVHALVGLLKTIDGTQSIIVRLQPPALGEVQIRVDRTAEGSAHVAITAERPETLALLQRDQPRLGEILDRAGIPPNGRSVNFQVAAPEQTGATVSRTDSMAEGSGGSGQGQSERAWRQNDDEQRDPGNGSGAGQGRARVRWFRAGLDITA
jgi:hypothetical protein